MHPLAHTDTERKQKVFLLFPILHSIVKGRLVYLFVYVDPSQKICEKIKCHFYGICNPLYKLYALHRVSSVYSLDNAYAFFCESCVIKMEQSRFFFQVLLLCSTGFVLV